jgi:hypothetical protein
VNGDKKDAIDEAMLNEMVRLRAENKRLEEKWREPGSRAWVECGRRQQLEHDIRGLLGAPAESQSVSGLRMMLQRILETSGRGPGHELSAPVAATEGAREVLRVWRLPEAGMLVVLDPNLRRPESDGTEVDQDPFDWGRVLHDVAKHVADYWGAHYEAEDGEPARREIILATIVEAFEAEAKHETSTTRPLPVD